MDVGKSVTSARRLYDLLILGRSLYLASSVQIGELEIENCELTFSGSENRQE